jgi:hypothetical protein
MLLWPITSSTASISNHLSQPFSVHVTTVVKSHVSGVAHALRHGFPVAGFSGQADKPEQILGNPAVIVRGMHLECLAVSPHRYWKKDLTVDDFVLKKPPTSINRNSFQPAACNRFNINHLRTTNFTRFQ